MGQAAVITDKTTFSKLWAGPKTRSQIAMVYGVSDWAVSAAARRFDLPARSHRRGISQKRVPPVPEIAEAIGDPMLAQVNRLIRQREAGRIPTPPFWTLDLDIQVLSAGGGYAGLNALADRLSIPYARVQARWHIVKRV